MPPLKGFTSLNEYPCRNQSPTVCTGTEYRPYLCTQYTQKILINLNLLRQDSRFCDVELIAGETKIPAHRAVLSAGSEYFEAMFRIELRLNEGKQQRSVIIHNIASDILQNLIDFIYIGKIYITQNNVLELLTAADMLQLSEVIEGCCEFLGRELHPTNALGMLRFAEAHNCKSLVKSATNCINFNFPIIALEDEFLDTPQTLLIRFLKSEYLRVDSESQVFLAALRWINHDIVKRRCYVFDILTNVRLALVSIHLIDEAIKECSDLSMKVALRSIRKDLISKRGQLVPIKASPRTNSKRNIYIIGGSRRETLTGGSRGDCILESVAKYDIFKREWSEVVSMEIGRILPGVATLHGKIYVIGGERGSQILANGEVYDIEKNNWQPIAPMIIPRCDFGVCTLNGILYAVGGWVGDDIGSSIECYDPIRNEWKMIDNMSKPRFSMGVVSFEGLIYIVGGCTTSSRHLSDLISYNPVTKEWNTLAHMQTARCEMGVAVLDRYLYVVGGNSIPECVMCSIERYSFDEDKWSTVAPMSARRSSPAVEAADGHIFVAGGDQICEVNFYREQITLNSVECYDPLTDSWEDCPNLPTSRSEAGIVAV